MSPSRVRRSVSAFALAAALALAAAPLRPAGAQSASVTITLAGAPLRFDHAIPLDEDVAVATRDAGLRALLRRTGAALAYAPGQRYVVVTAADRRTITFTLGDARLVAGGVTSSAAFAPFLDGGDAVIPLLALARALYLVPVTVGDGFALVPALGGLDARVEGRRSIVTLRGALPLTPRVSPIPGGVALAFAGTAATVGGTRRGLGPALADVTVATSGTPQQPTTTVTFTGARGAAYRVATAPASADVVVGFAPAGVALDDLGPAVRVAAVPENPTPAPRAVVVDPRIARPPAPQASTAAGPGATPTPEAVGPDFASPTPAAAAPGGANAGGPATVTDVGLAEVPDGFNARIAVSGNASYTWHRLGDGRWYVDIAGATLASAGRDERPPSGVVESVRIRQIGTPEAPAVRVALTLRGERRVEVSGYDGGLLVAVAETPALEAARSGSGRIGASLPPDAASAVAQTQPEPSATPIPSGWKFGPSGPLSGSRLIVIDPGHGGGDVGTQHNGLTEKNLTWDISQRLRADLVAAGWTVRMTRDSDIDPVDPVTLARFRGDGKPLADDRAALQTRADVANANGARLFVSVHVNYADSASASGTTTYWWKPQDLALAGAVQRSIIGRAGTVDDGTRKERFYVLNHTTMPSILVETAFISNAADVVRLGDPVWRQTMADAIATGVKSYLASPAANAVSRGDAGR